MLSYRKKSYNNYFYNYCQNNLVLRHLNKYLLLTFAPFFSRPFLTFFLAMTLTFYYSRHTIT